MSRLIKLEGMVGKHPVHLTHVQDATLVAHGYQPIPVMAREKRPQIMGWTKGEMTTERIVALRASHLDHISTGLRTGRLVGIDLDIVDPEHIKKVITLAEQVLGPTPLHRFGSKGDLSCYRNETPIPKITIKAGEALIEILGSGQQFVAFGLHPRTGWPYQWTVEDPNGLGINSPLTVEWSELPEVTPEQLRDFAAKASPSPPRLAPLILTFYMMSILQLRILFPRAQITLPARELNRTSSKVLIWKCVSPCLCGKTYQALLCPLLIFSWTYSCL